MIQLTPGQEKFIEENKHLRAVDLARELGIPPHRITNYKHRDKKKPKPGMFNVNECKNWVADQGIPPAQKAVLTKVKFNY